MTTTKAHMGDKDRLKEIVLRHIQTIVHFEVTTLKEKKMHHIKEVLNRYVQISLKPSKMTILFIFHRTEASR